MIYVFQILRRIRLDKQYNANAIAKNLNVSEKWLRNYEDEFHPLPPNLLDDWLKVLDISIQDKPWFIQKHEREKVYHILYSELKDSVPPILLERVSDVLALRELIDISHIETLMQRHTLNHILYRPRSAEVAIDNIIAKRKHE